MTLQHGNRVRKNGGEQVVRDVEAADASEMAEIGPTEEEIRQRAHEIYLSRNGAPGNAEADWLQAENELRARNRAAAELFVRPR